MINKVKISYMLLHFPYLTETFVAEELRALRARGVDVNIVSLLEPGAGPVQPVSQMLLPYTQYAPSLTSLTLWSANLKFICRQFGLYLTLLWQLLSCSYTSQPLSRLSKRIVIFLKAVAVAAQLEGEGIQLIHAHFAWLSAAGAWVTARLLGIPFSVTIHAYDIFTSTDLLPLIMREAAHVVAISEYNRRYIHEQGLRDAANISVVHCGINPAQFFIDQEAFTNVNWEQKPLQILSVGSLNQKKGHNYLIAACDMLAERGVNFECHIIGSGHLKDSLNKQIERANLQRHVHLLGPMSSPEVFDAYRQHDLFVLPSVIADDGDRDGIPVVMMEAGAVGLPLISSNVSGIPELVRHRQTGILVPPQEVPPLADAIAALANDPELRQLLGRQASQLIFEEFNVEINVARLWCHFMDVINSQPAA